MNHIKKVITWAWIERQALGVMMMPLIDYENITLAEFFNKLKGFYEFETERQKQSWERMQFVAYSMLMNNPYVKNNDKPKSFESYMKSATKEVDKNKGVQKLTRQQFERLIDG